MLSQLDVKTQCWHGLKWHTRTNELLRNSGRCVNVPLPPSRVVLDSPTPLDDAALLADVDFLARSNQSNHHTPFGHAVRELDEEFWLGLVVGGAAVLVSDLYHFRIERPLCL